MTGLKKILKARLQSRSHSVEEWESLSDYVLLDGECGYVRNTHLFKIGDGKTPWQDLPWQDASPYHPGQIVPATGSGTKAEVFNDALLLSPVDKTARPGVNSHAENVDTFAGGEGAHAENIGTRAMAYGSHAEGNNTEVKTVGKFGHAGGNGSIVEAEAGFAHGVNAASKNRGEAVFGKNNEPDASGKSIFQVGIGENKKHPKTGFQIDVDGSIWLLSLSTGIRMRLQDWLQSLQLNKEVVDSLPAVGEPNTVYLRRVIMADKSRHNFFEEYIYLNGSWELLGTSDTDESIIERILANPLFRISSQNIANNAIQKQHMSSGAVGNDALEAHSITQDKLSIEVLQALLPQSRYNKKEDCLCAVGKFIIPPGLGLPYVGVQTYINRRWKLTDHIGGFVIDLNKRPQANYAKLQSKVENIISDIGWRALHLVANDGNGYVNLRNLFHSEFIALGDIVELTNDLSSNVNWSVLRLFSRNKRNINGGPSSGLGRMLPSAHNRICISGNNIPFHFDIVRKGNKQVIRRKYKIGYVWPISRDESNNPIWSDGYYASNWTTVLVEEIVYLYSLREPKLNIKIL